jgi:hypothetical protein
VTRRQFDRAAVTLGAAGVLAAVFVLTDGDPWQLVRIRAVAAILTTVLGGMAIAGGLAGRAALVLAAGAGYLIAALLQLAQFGRDTNWVGGSGSTVSYFLGLGVGLVVITLALESDRSSSDSKDS